VSKTAYFETGVGDRTVSAVPVPLGQYLVNRLHELGVRHAFGVPGDYALGLFKLFEQSAVTLVGSTNELCAGYAADAYARLNGLGVVLVTYGVGGFSTANAIACAYAEKSPLVLISGAPGQAERRPDQLLHHTVGGYETQCEVFARLTCAHAVLDDPLTAFRETDRVLAACLRHKRPVYLEVPRDRVQQRPLYAHAPVAEVPATDPAALAEAVGEAVALLRASRKPVILAGIEVHRFGLERAVLRFAEAAGIPVAAMLLSKSVVPECHPLYAGVYLAAAGRPEVTRFVEDSDCVLMLGTLLTDVDTGIFTHHLDDGRLIVATSEQVGVRRHFYRAVRMEDFLAALAREGVGPFDHAPPPPAAVYGTWEAKPTQPVTVRRLFEKLNSCLDAHTVVLADPGDALFGAADLTVHQDGGFLGASFYATLGWAVPAAVGAQLARPRLRPVVVVGDGAFQMTGTELGTARRHGLNPVVVVLNNRGYLTERFLLEGAFNDIPDWNYHRLPDLLGAGNGFDVRTEGDLDDALSRAFADPATFSVLNVHVAADDTSPALRRLTEALASRV
jgi:indolepyruvate decarboxylase